MLGRRIQPIRDIDERAATLNLPMETARDPKVTEGPELE
jgi:hypothetical protein